MSHFNELELREILRKRRTPELQLKAALKAIADPSISWEERRPIWHFLWASGFHKTLSLTLAKSLRSKFRTPFDLIVALLDRHRIVPSSLVLSALEKGLTKQDAISDIAAPVHWLKLSASLKLKHSEYLDLLAKQEHELKQGLIDKFEFLVSQRMRDQAMRVLQRLIDTYPEDKELKRKKSEMEQQWARDIFSERASMPRVIYDEWERTHTEKSPADLDMLENLSLEATKIYLEDRGFAASFAMSMLFIGEYSLGLDALVWAEESPSKDWLKAELLLMGRRYVELLDWLQQLEIKYISDPETTFAVSYLRARALKALGQRHPAIEILKSIVQIRPHYRSAHALILEWAEGELWD